MGRPIIMYTGQWADLPLEALAQKMGGWGFDGMELACAGDHFEPDKVLESDAHVRRQQDLLAKHGLKAYALTAHLVGQCVCDEPIDERHRRILPPHVWGDGRPRRRSGGGPPTN